LTVNVLNVQYENHTHQDTLPQGGFGNLIALPCRSSRVSRGNSLFLDDDFNPHADQWAFQTRHLVAQG
jgi:hypothetical protein